MSDHPKVAIFWDYENCSPPTNSSGLGYDIVNNISRIARLFGSVTTFRAYLDISAQSPKSVPLRSELQSSGVSMIDCPHNGRKDVVDKMILVDMLAFVVDHRTPATLILITGDRDYAYAVSTLKLRKYQVILVVPSSLHTSPSLESQASLIIDWGAAVLRSRPEAVHSMQAVRQPYLGVDVNLVTKLLRELHDSAPGDPDTTKHVHSNAAQGTPNLRRTSTCDLLEPSRPHKITRSFDSTWENDPALPGKSMCTASDPIPGALPIPKTPLRSRHASISTGSARARSITTVAHSPPAVEQDIHVENPPLWRAGTSDITDVVGTAKYSPSVVPPPDMLELPSHDSGPPSPIIVRPLLEDNQSLPVSRIPTLSFSHERNYPASTDNSQSQPTAGPTSPIMAPTKTHPEIVMPGVCGTPQMKGTEVPKGTGHLNRTRIDASDTNSGWSILNPVHAKEGLCGATDTLKPNYHSHAAPRPTYSPPNRNVGDPTDTPLSKDNSAFAACLRGVGSGVDSQRYAFPRELNTLGCSTSGPKPAASSGAFPSAPFAATESHEHDDSGRRETWAKFKPLIHVLLAARERGFPCPSRSTIAMDLVQSDQQVYRRAGVSRFRDYTALAEQAGVIELGGRDGDAWIALHPGWFGAGGAATHFLSSSTSSPASDPLEMTQNPLLTSPKILPIEGTVILQSPTFTSPKFDALENSYTLQTDRQGGSPRVFIPARFRPLIDSLIRRRAEGFDAKTLRSVVGQLLGQDVYAQAGVSGFKEYIYQASEAQLVQLGGVGGHAWICLHPELRI